MTLLTYVLQDMAEVERKLSVLQNDQLKTKELELKAAQDRRLAIEELEKAVG